MVRVVVPPQKRSESTGPGGRFRQSGSEADGDDLPTKLVKYIPGETLAFFVPVAAMLGSTRDGWLIGVTVVGALGTAGWLWVAAKREPERTKKPLWHFYLLSVLAFAVWALVTAPRLAEIANIDVVVAGVLLAAAVFLIPMLDNVLNSLQGR